MFTSCLELDSQIAILTAHRASQNALLFMSDYSLMTTVPQEKTNKDFTQRTYV